MSGGGKATRAEREDILRIARQREKVAKSEARRRSSELKADFENKLASHFSFDQSPVWAAAMCQADLVVKEMDERIAAECEKLGIPRQFRPRISVVWYSRGENASRTRRLELRTVADSRIAALEKRAFEEIERQNLNFQTKVLCLGLTSPEAQGLLAEMPTAEQLMPPLNLQEVILALAKGPQALPFSRYDALQQLDDGGTAS
jgi:hypothetical protein